MLKIGEFQTLTIAREMPQGFYLENEEGDEVLLPGPYITPEMAEGDTLEVFVYCDSNDREIASTEKPFFLVNQFAYLEVTGATDFGVFCNWGVSKELFVPLKNQAQRMELGKKYVIHMYLDEVSERLVGTTKLNPFLYNEMDDDFETGEKVQLLIYSASDLGYKAVINNTHTGLIYKSDAVKPIVVGETMAGYIKKPREDGLIDLSLQPIGHHSIEPNAEMILEKLENAGNFLPFTDKSDAELIRKYFGISKKLFKKSLGALYKKKLVLLKPDGIYKV